MALEGTVGASIITNAMVTCSEYSYSIVFDTSNGPQNDVGNGRMLLKFMLRRIGLGPS